MSELVNVIADFFTWVYYTQPMVWFWTAGPAFIFIVWFFADGEDS